MTDADRLLREIVANPAADVLRLAFADAIEERDGPGDEAWAEFIRVQVELHRDYFARNRGINDRFHGLRARERDLWPAVRGRFEGWGVVPVCDVAYFGGGSVVTLVRRGFPAVVRCTLAEWMGGECECLDEDIAVMHLANSYQDAEGIRCRRCNDSRRTPGIGPRLAQAWPVERVEVTDAVIHRSGGNDTYYVGGLGVFPKEFWRGLEGHRTIASARAALSAACLALARSQVI